VKKVKLAQEEDEELEKLKKKENYQQIDGIWYWKQPWNEIRKEQFRLVILRRLRKTLLEENHDSLMGSHLGIKRTYAKLAQNYYWPGRFGEFCFMNHGNYEKEHSLASYWESSV
jgi:hypothetical protein